MASQQSLDQAYMKMAYAAAELSRAERRKVGAILVTPNEGRFEGVNGTPAGFDNTCEDVEYFAQSSSGAITDPKWIRENCFKLADGRWRTKDGRYFKTQLVTKPEVLHAESNAIMKVARSHASSVGGTMYCTLAPCLECAKLIIQAGIIRVVYGEEYPYPGHLGQKRPVGLALLEKAGIVVDFLPPQRHNNDKELVSYDDGFNDPNNCQYRS